MILFEQLNNSFIVCFDNNFSLWNLYFANTFQDKLYSYPQSIS